MQCGIPSVPTKRSVLETSCDTVLVALQATFAVSILLVLRACFGALSRTISARPGTEMLRLQEFCQTVLA